MLQFLSRYLTYFVVGTAVEATRLLTFWFAVKHMPFELASAVSIPLNIVVSFLLHGGITWRDRQGSFLGKLWRFTLSKALIITVKLVLPFFWIHLAFLSCPLYEPTHAVVSTIALVSPEAGQVMTDLFTCDWMSIAFFDFVVAMTLGFFTFDRFSFKERRKPADIGI